MYRRTEQGNRRQQTSLRRRCGIAHLTNAFFLEKRPLVVNFQFQNSVPKVYMSTPIDVVVFKCRKICLTGNRRNHALFTSPKKNKISAASQTVPTARIAPKICQGQPPTYGSHCSGFNPNRFTFGGVIAERVNTVLLPRKVFPWFARSEASLRAIVNECPSCRQSGVNSGVSPVVKSGVDCWQ